MTFSPHCINYIGALKTEPLTLPPCVAGSRCALEGKDVWHVRLLEDADLHEGFVVADFLPRRQIQHLNHEQTKTGWVIIHFCSKNSGYWWGLPFLHHIIWHSENARLAARNSSTPAVLQNDEIPLKMTSKRNLFTVHFSNVWWIHSDFFLSFEHF